jgi:trk system potassium uptake protein TrkA
MSWVVHRAVELLCYSRLETLLGLGSGEVEIVESDVPQLLVGRPVSELTAPGEVSVVAISRHGKTFIPVPGTEFREGDIVHLARHVASGERLKGLLGLQ